MVDPQSSSRLFGANDRRTRRTDQLGEGCLGVIYLDSCVVIYAVEDAGALGTAVRQRLASMANETVAISSLVKLECLVGPLRNDDLALADHYRRAFEQFELVELSDAQYQRAAEIRARHGIKTPDALHLAAAQGAGCTEFWTADSRLAAVSHGLAVDVLAGAGRIPEG
ncbi:hypothetical protein B7R22_17495 [Subtercola boreus]|uniref:Ribonuclease VapC n=1 Tax=Subtercola boreus TaxID=120213 RepID=A0A3E0VR92_9MICO|nr:hypothetical protein B7R22_17495 [Subtercola boreus]